MEKLELHIEGMHCFRAVSLPRPRFLGHPRFPNPSCTGNRMDGFPTPSFRNAFL